MVPPFGKRATAEKEYYSIVYLCIDLPFLATGVAAKDPSELFSESSSSSGKEFVPTEGSWTIDFDTSSNSGIALVSTFSSDTSVLLPSSDEGFLGDFRDTGAGVFVDIDRLTSFPPFSFIAGTSSSKSEVSEESEVMVPPFGKIFLA